MENNLPTLTPSRFKGTSSASGTSTRIGRWWNDYCGLCCSLRGEGNLPDLKRAYFAIFFVFILVFQSCSAGDKSVVGHKIGSSGHRVRIGAEVFMEKYLDSLSNKRVGVVCNQTSVLPDGTHLVDTLQSRGVNITALFGPEHGIRGTAAAGEIIGSNKDAKTGIQVYSLYGKTRKPTPEMLKNVDVLVFDIQDVGARFYTYLSTMAYCIEAASENHKKIIILDRPNPINGIEVDGPVLDTAFKSFVGMLPIPIRHGMTLGELAKMIVGEKWIKIDAEIDLQVIPMENWKRTMWFDETSLPWIPPSPNMKTLATATVYPGTCLFEATNVTEGRGTEKPFEYIGAPWIDKDNLAKTLNGENLEGVKFEPMEFTPAADSVSAPSPKFNNEKCGGIFIDITDRTKYHPFESAITILQTIQQQYPDKFTIKREAFNRLAGANLLDDRGSLSEKIDFQPIMKDISIFQSLRKKYLLY
jgi:uncharacterized protein YbbC (DUF1343 family)